MRAKVLKAYRDRVKRTTHQEGETVTLTAERLEELEAAGFVEPIVVPKKRERQTYQTKEDKTPKEDK